MGKLIALRDTHTVNVGRWQVDTMEPNLHLLPLWTETQGSGGATVTAQDTVGHDGWDRVVEVAYFKNGSLLDTARYNFDRDGNIRVGTKFGATPRSYDLATTRLTDFGSLDYRYDRAGNLDSVTSGTPAWKFVYDALDRLIEVRQGGTLISRYAYDVLGRRIVKRVYSGTGAGYLRMIYRGSTAVAEADSAGCGAPPFWSS